ncbi:MAG: four-helix bundle copper-binding protein [Solirubrobacteraceae bacterium]
MTDTYTLQMLDALPAAVPVEGAALAAAIDACLPCVQACTACADSDLIEPDVARLRACIAINVVCADICEATARVLSRPAQWDLLTVRDLLVTCVRSCTACAEECDRHAEHHRHCAICAAVCRACIRACTVLLESEALQARAMSAAT